MARKPKTDKFEATKETVEVAKSKGTASLKKVEDCKEILAKHKTAIVVAVGAVLCGWIAYNGYSQHQAIQNLEAKLATVTSGGKVVTTTEKVTAKATQKAEQAQFAKTLNEMPSLDKVVEMDVKKLRAFRDKEGRVLYMLDNGRFVFVGDMIDVWGKKKIETLEELDAVINRVDLKSLGLEVEKTNHITFGEGQKRVVAVVDPFCGWCHRLIQEIRSDKSLQKDYTFEFIIAGFLGQKSQDAAKTLACSIAPAEAKLNALLAGGDAMSNLIKTPNCDESKLKETQLAVSAMGIQSVPYIIAPDGRFNRGKPRDIRAFLENKVQPQAPSQAKAPERPKVDITPLKNVKRQDLNIMTAGNGPRMLSVFVDPNCGWCHKSMEEILSDDYLLKNYTVDFIATSILGPSSEKLNKMVACSKGGDKTLQAFREGKKGIEALGASDSCKETKTEKTNELRQRMNLRSVPVFVRDNGQVQTGKPASIRAFLGLPPKGGEDAQTKLKEAVKLTK